MKKFIFSALFFLLLGLCACSGKKKNYDYRIGLDPTWYPLELAGREKNVVAFTSELLQEIGRMKKIKLALVSMSWDNLLWGLSEGKYEAALSSMQPYLFYEQKYSFSNLYLSTGPTLVVPETSGVNALDLMKGREIAVIRGSSASLLLQKYPGLILRSYDSVPEAFNDILKSVVDGAVVDLLIAQAYVRDLYHGELKLATGALNDQGLRLMTFHNQVPELMNAFNEGLAELKKSGRYDEMLKKWGLSSNPQFKVDIEHKALDELIQFFIL